MRCPRFRFLIGVTVFDEVDPIDCNSSLRPERKKINVKEVGLT